MVKGSLAVYLAPATRAALNQAGFRLCFAFSFGDNLKFNTVARSASISSKTTFSWTEDYSMFATDQAFKAGEVISEELIAGEDKSGQSKVLDVKFGQVYRVTGWDTPAVVRPDSTLPDNSFGFCNDIQAAPVVCMIMAGFVESTPLFIGDIMPAPSRAVFTPKIRVAAWFQRELQEVVMIELSTADAHIVDMSDVTNFETTYEEGQWNDKGSTEYQKVDYFNVTPAFVGVN